MNFLDYIQSLDPILATIMMCALAVITVAVVYVIIKLGFWAFLAVLAVGAVIYLTKPVDFEMPDLGGLFQ